MKKVKKPPGKERVALFMKKAMEEKLDLPAQARKIQADAVEKLYHGGHISKRVYDDYMSLTKSRAREIAQKV